MISRRGFAQAVVATTALSSSLMRSKPAAAELDFEQPKDLMKTLVKMRGSLKSELIIWYLRGPVYGVVDQKVTPLWGLHSVNFNHFQKRDDDSYSMTSAEFNYPYDLKTGDHIKTFDNPFTDETIELSYRPFGPNILYIYEDGIRLPPEREEFKSAKLETIIGPVHIHDNDAWLFEDFYAEVPSMSADGRAWYANDITTYKATLDELNDDAVAAAQSTLSFQSVVSWQAWMNMADHPGHMMSRLAGKKLFSRDGLPAWFLEVAEREHPDMIRNAEKLIGLP